MVDSLKEVLKQGERLILSLDDEIFTTKIPLASNATIGAHYRHTLEHFRSLFEGLQQEEIDYDARRRDPLIETQREAALLETRALMEQSSCLDDCDLDESIMARFKVSYTGTDSTVAESTLGREVMFCISHAIHHYALIAIMARLLEVSLPSGFGVAPSTINYQRAFAENS
jgi:uncharacterized damage-inducible protein DinB